MRGYVSWLTSGPPANGPDRTIVFPAEGPLCIYLFNREFYYGKSANLGHGF
jgi:hypothetical protein